MTREDIERIFREHGIPMAPPDDPYYQNEAYTVTFVPARPQLGREPKRKPKPYSYPGRP